LAAPWPQLASRICGLISSASAFEIMDLFLGSSFFNVSFRSLRLIFRS
jgi:hypothetical protein